MKKPSAIMIQLVGMQLNVNSMTAREPIKALQDLGKDNLDREIVMFDGPSYYTPYKVEVLIDKSWGHQKGKILID